MAAVDLRLCIQRFRTLIPPLNFEGHKGVCGRIGIVGGSKDYTGAPYFAAISTLLVGADLAHVFCSADSSSVIKAFCPELIVHPVLDASNAVAEISQWLPRLHALVIGPGLGRDPAILQNVAGVINEAKSREIPLVVDADGLHLINTDPSLIRNYRQAILTPNSVEFQRLYEANCDPFSGSASALHVEQLARTLGNVTIMAKGQNEFISDGIHAVVNTQRGCPRRIGGQGDILSGVTGAFLAWTSQRSGASSHDHPVGPALLAGAAASVLVRECATAAFLKRRRSMITSHMLDEIQGSFEKLFPE